MYYLFITSQVICRFVCIGKKSPVYFFWTVTTNFHTRLAIVTENELGLAFPPRNLSNKFRPDLSTFYLVIVVTNKQTNKQTNRQTDRQTYASDSIIPRESFRGDNNNYYVNENRMRRSWNVQELSYRRGTARCVVSVEILRIATQQCRNYLYDKSWTNRSYEVGGSVGGNV